MYLSIIPDKNCYLAEQSGHLSIDYSLLEEQLLQQTGFADYISISDLLESGDYYRTDVHWRQEQITDVAERLAQAMGVTLSKDYKENLLERDFYGVYCGQSALPLAPDSLYYLTNDAIENCTVYDFENNRAGQVYDFGRASGEGPLRAVSFRTFVAADYGESSGASRTGVDFVSRLLRFQYRSIADQRIF